MKNKIIFRIFRIVITCYLCLIYSVDKREISSSDDILFVTLMNFLRKFDKKFVRYKYVVVYMNYDVFLFLNV